MNPQNIKRKILVVDGDAAERENMELFFQERGYETTPVSSGEQALQKLAETPFHVVVSVVKLPAMDGFALQQHLSLRHPSLPVILLGASFRGRRHAPAWTEPAVVAS